MAKKSLVARFTDKEYRMIRYCGSRGITWDDIARLVGIHKKTLERDGFAQEEYRIGRAAAKLRVSETFFQMATSGLHPVMTIFAAKVMLGFSEDGKSFSDQEDASAMIQKLVSIPSATFGKVSSDSK